MKTCSKLARIGLPPTEQCLTCIAERQTTLKPRDVVSVASKCKYGFPQAYTLRPVNVRTSSVFSGNLRLTCPHLVKAIDEWEDDGGIEQVNEDMKNNAELRSSFSAVNQFWNEVKLEMMSPTDHDIVKQRLGDGYRHFVESGIIGISKDKEHDVKCLHAVVADYILRNRTSNTSEGINRIGEHVMEKLTQRGVNITGSTGNLNYIIVYKCAA